MKFYNQLLHRSLEITQSKALELRVLVSEDFGFPSMRRDGHGRVLCVPKPVRRKKGFLLHGIIFENNDLGRTLMMKTLMASVEHLSIHYVVSDFSIYSAWLKGKDHKIAAFVADLIEDLCVKVYARTRLSGLLQDMALANAVSYASITPPEKINSAQSLLQSALLSFLIAGRYRFALSSGIKKDLAAIIDLLQNFERTILQREKQDESPWWADDEIKEKKLKLATGVYKRLTKYGPTREAIYMPYTDSHGKIARASQELALPMSQSVDIVSDTFRTLGLQPFSKEPVEALLDNSVREEAESLLYDLVVEERWKTIVMENYMELAKDTEFEELIFPKEDLAEYSRSYAQYAGSIKKIIEQTRMLKNGLATNTHQEAGEIDMQEVIQSIASQKMSGRIFVRDEYLEKSEAWGILLDISTSLRPFSITAREMALCLSEIAKELIADDQSWGLYAFSNRFAIIKDIREDYTQNVKARIGGLQQGGLSYIPDALQLGARIVTSADKDNNFLFVISDGLPAGYPNIDAKLEKTVKDIIRRGITIIPLGIGSTALQKYIRGTSLNVDNASDLMGKFTKMYFSLMNE